MALDETCLSNGELYTILSNKLKRGQKGSIVALFKGTKSSDIIKLIKEHIPEIIRKKVLEISVDMANNMNLIIKKCFKMARAVTDRFHVQKLALDAVQELRIKYRWKILNKENKAYKKAKLGGQAFHPEVLINGDTQKQLLARSRYLLFKSMDKWTDSQALRAKILFELYPNLEKAYHLSDRLRQIYNQKIEPDVARLKLAKWFDEIEKSGFDSFNSIKKTFEVHHQSIINYFISRSTNAFAESFNAKIKDFRRKLRGVVDVKYFLFRLTKIYA